MAERIHGLERSNTYRVDAADDSNRQGTHDHQQDDDQHEEQKKKLSEDTFSGFDEKTNWKNFLDHSRLWKKSIEIPKHNIDRIYFSKLNIKSDPSLLRVNIRLKDGSSIKPGFVSMSREMAIKCQHLKPGTPMSFETISMEDILRVTLPQESQNFNHQLQNLSNTKINPKIEKGVIGSILSSLSLINPKTGGLRVEGLLINFILLSMVILIVTAIILILE